ncbi:MAG TPA: hypothetical protein VHB50_08875 [Bryobacteraceae bacterium]|nr:hypothetical protein [Bryobacteraceae bacterium]
MTVRTLICLFDLPSYDRRVAPALRRYRSDYNPDAVIVQLREVRRRKELDADDSQHWIDSLAPDAGYKPSEQTIRELANMLVHGLCLVKLQDMAPFVPWLSEQSEWFADLMQGGEELAGGRLEFTFGSGSLIATRQQIHQFLEVIRNAQPPESAAQDYENLRGMLESADSNPNYTLLKTTVE